MDETRENKSENKTEKLKDGKCHVKLKTTDIMERQRDFRSQMSREQHQETLGNAVSSSCV